MSEVARNAVPAKLGYPFRNRAFLDEALPHASWRNEHPSAGGRDNERLE
jgi:dsRNA-specific ribonuclease